MSEEESEDEEFDRLVQNARVAETSEKDPRGDDLDALGSRVNETSDEDPRESNENE